MQAIAADALAELGDAASGAPLTVPLAVNADSLATWFVPALAAAGADLTSTSGAPTRRARPSCCATAP